MNRRVRTWFERFGAFVYQNPKKMLLLVLLATMAMVSQLPKLTIDTTNEGFFHPDSEIIANYNQFRNQYGREDVLIISIAPEQVFDFDFLRRLQAFHAEIENSIPYLEEVTSLLNARNTRGEGNELIVEDLFETWPQSEAELQQLKDRAMSNPVYRNALLSADGSITAVIVELNAYADMGGSGDFLAGFDDLDLAGEQFSSDNNEKREFLTGPQTTEVINAANALVEKYNGEDFRLHISGFPIMSESLKVAMRGDMARFTLIGITTIVLVLWLMFRRLSGVVAPFITVLLTLFSTLGMLGATGTAFKMQTSVLPSFLIAVSVGSAVHILTIFYKQYDSGAEKQQALQNAMSHSGLPVLMACLTTAVGLMSFINASVAPIADLGLFAGIGVLISLIYTLIMIPAFMALFPVRRKALVSGKNDYLDRLLGFIADFSVRFAKPIVAVCTIFAVVAVFGTFRLYFYQDPITWFGDDVPIRVDTLAINDQLKGVVSLEVIVDTGVENGLYEPAILNQLAALDSQVKEVRAGDIFSEKTISIVDIVKEINQALHAGDPAYYQIPDNRELVAQELFLFESSGTDDLEDFVDSQFSQARYSIRIPWSDALAIDAYNHKIERLVEDQLQGSANITITGIASMFGDIVYTSVESMKEAYFLAIVIISALMILFIGDWKIGLLSMIPNLSPILMTLGFMGFMGIPITVFTMFVGAIAIGLAVDDTLHFLHTFNRYYRDGDTAEVAIRKSFLTTGRALMVTTVVLSLAFFTYMFGSLLVIVQFGLFTGLTILMALFGDFVLTPALLSLIFKEKTEQVSESPLTEEA